MAGRARCYAFTINAVGDNDLPEKPKLEIGVNNCIYFKYQLERGEHGRKHYQGCVRFDNPKTLNAVKTALGVPHAHIEKAIDWKKLVEYCGKEDTRIEPPVEAGNDGEQGKRSDIHQVAQMVTDGVPLPEIARTLPGHFIKYHKGIIALDAEIHREKFRPNLKVYCLFGCAGVGKTFFVHKYFPEHYAVADMKHPWFDGYRQEKVVLFDDYGPGLMSIENLKRFLDVYKCKAPYKGGFVAFNPDLIFLTTNHPLHAWYTGPGIGPLDLDALRRRITVIDLEGPAYDGFRERNEALIRSRLEADGVLPVHVEIVESPPPVPAADADTAVAGPSVDGRSEEVERPIPRAYSISELSRARSVSPDRKRRRGLVTSRTRHGRIQVNEEWEISSESSCPPF